jgi:predicted nucleic acid-binding protein
VIVLDSSVVIDAFQDQTCAEKLRELFLTENFVAPDHIGLEVLYTLRRFESEDKITALFANQCLAVFEAMPLKRYSCAAMTREIWALRHNVTAYDAPFVVLAKQLNAPLLTHDGKLARAVAKHIKLMSLLIVAP